MASVSPCKGGPQLHEWGAYFAAVLCVEWKCTDTGGEDPILAVYCPPDPNKGEGYRVLVLAGADVDDENIIAYAGQPQSWHRYNPAGA
jgi:hypothetical protein